MTYKIISSCMYDIDPFEPQTCISYDKLFKRLVIKSKISITSDGVVLREFNYEVDLSNLSSRDICHHITLLNGYLTTDASLMWGGKQTNDIVSTNNEFIIGKNKFHIEKDVTLIFFQYVKIVLSSLLSSISGINREIYSSLIDDDILDDGYYIIYVADPNSIPHGMLLDYDFRHEMMVDYDFYLMAINTNFSTTIRKYFCEINIDCTLQLRM